MSEREFYQDPNAIDTLNRLRKSAFKSPQPYVLRVSGLPYCPIVQLHEVCESNHIRISDFAEEFYTTIGTAVHALIQKHMANSEPKLFGNWSCKTCGIDTTVPSHIIPCPKRQEDPDHSCLMEYKEIDFEYLSLSGHLDTLTCSYNSKTKSYEAWEYKTTGSFLFGNPKAAAQYYPNKKHIVQIETYCTLLYILYKIPVSKYHIVYFNREKVKDLNGQRGVVENISAGRDTTQEWEYGLFSHVFTKAIFNERKSQLITADANFKLFQKAMEEIKTTNTITTNTAKAIEASKPCQKFHDYGKLMASHFFKGGCPYFEDASCFSKDPNIGPISILKDLAKAIAKNNKNNTKVVKPLKPEAKETKTIKPVPSKTSVTKTGKPKIRKLVTPKKTEDI